MYVSIRRTMSGVTWMLLLITCLDHVLMTSGCPGGCYCTPKDDGMIVTCDRQNFTSLPVDIPTNTVDLILMHNNIQTLRQNLFTGLTMLKELTMRHCGIEHIEANAFSELTALLNLDISNNEIHESQRHAFSRMPKLKTLSIDNTQLGAIHDFAFAGLNLTDLSLENNKNLLQISAKAFYSSKIQNIYIYGANLNSDSIMALRPLTSSLKELHVDYNQPSELSIPEEVFQGFTFRKLKMTNNGIRDPLFLMFVKADDISLEGNPLGPIDFGKYPSLKDTRILRLSKTGFSVVKASYFSEMENLRSLYLDNNGITYLPEKIKDSFQLLERLTLGGNPLHCNCEMLWLRRWHAESSDVTVLGATCHTPTQGDMLAIEESEYTCTHPSLVDVTGTLNVSETKEISLSCIARGDPAPAVIWELPSGLSEETPPPTNTSINLNKGVYKIPRAVMAHAGLYKCYAYNSVGNVTALAKVDVYRSTGSAESSSPESVLVPPLMLISCSLAILLYNLVNL